MMSYSQVAEQAVERAIDNEYSNEDSILEFVWDSLTEYALENDERLMDSDGELLEGAELWIEDTNHPVGKEIQEAYDNCGAGDILSEVQYFRSCGGWEGYYGVSRYD